MNLMRLCTLLCLYWLLSGCAYIHSLDDDLPTQIDKWIENKDYGKALDTLDYIQADNVNFQHLIIQKDRIIKLANAFEQEILQQGQMYQKANDWHRAYEVYEYGMDKLPDSRPIHKAQTEFLNKRAAYLKQLKLKLLQNKTKWLLRDTEIRNEIARVIPKNYSAKWLMQDHNLDIDATSKTLIECVTDSIAINELDVGRQCLDIVKQLNPSVYFQQRIIEVSKSLEQEIESRSRNLSKHGQKTLRSARLAVAKGDFISANQVINSLTEQDRKNGEVLRFKDELDEKTDDYVDKAMLEGRKLYSVGKVQEAYLLWKSLKSLAPDNERLEALIIRVEKVLRKLHKIGSNQDIVIPPGKL